MLGSMPGSFPTSGAAAFLESLEASDEVWCRSEKTMAAAF
eukprot:CAMPEP_0181288878 /NCGR_PEP_ID=MMETSP1101-20121128/578_1 /TAXON_ID=46948 /ORGANISM="Rhodomonas abbreviata, Strain Caron Lab Isolate" /LENGTH=39 /DNA_ID= /DNA_START= /DNA_END= /DNA_ORIENTATION=